MYTKSEMYGIARKVCEDKLSNIYSIIHSTANDGLFECSISTEKDLDLFVKEIEDVEKTLCKIKAIRNVLEGLGFNVYLNSENRALKGSREYFSVVTSINVSWY